MTGGRTDNWVCGGQRWSLGSERFLHMITTQCSGTALPIVPPSASGVSIRVLFKSLPLSLFIGRPVNPKSCDDIQDAVKILQEPQGLPTDQRSLHGLAAVR